MATLTKTQIDRLGDRLRKGSPSEADLRTLDKYRRSFGDAYETVVRGIREKLELRPTGRPEKSTASIIDKLRRESIRLSQIQDIAGCRIVVTDTDKQDRVVGSLRPFFQALQLRIDVNYRATDIGPSTSSRKSPDSCWRFRCVVDCNIYGQNFPKDYPTESTQVSNMVGVMTELEERF